MSERKGMKQYPEWVKEQVREWIAAGETQKQLFSDSADMLLENGEDKDSDAAGDTDTALKGDKIEAKKRTGLDRNRIRQEKESTICAAVWRTGYAGGIQADCIRSDVTHGGGRTDESESCEVCPERKQNNGRNLSVRNTASLCDESISKGGDQDSVYGRRRE